MPNYLDRSENAFEFINQLFLEIGRDPSVILLAGVHQGESTLRYIDLFPDVHIFGFEPESNNLEAAKKNLGWPNSHVSLSNLALSNHKGSQEFKVNSHNATHSFFEIGRGDLWDSIETTKERLTVGTTTVDEFCQEIQISHIDLLHLDTQGSEVLALQGASKMLAAGRILFIRCEVAFYELYVNQPLFWEIGSFLSTLNFRFIKLVDPVFRESKVPKMVWADALFVSNQVDNI